MTTGRLRETFALLLREKHVQAATLSTDAERAIRRRIAVRWAGFIAVLVLAGTLGTTAAAGAYGGRGGAHNASHSPIPTPTIGFAAATFPLGGGPDFVPASSGLKCGDPAPPPHSVGNDLKLEVTPSDSTVVSLPGSDQAAVPAVNAVISHLTNKRIGTVSTSGIDILVVQDGIIKGMLDGEGTQLATALSSSSRSDWPSLLVAERTHCPNEPPSNNSGVAPGTYQLVAIGRVFSTPESVALSQTLGSSWYLDAGTQTDPHGVYLPGSYDCHGLELSRSTVRACLPDITKDAVVDPKAGTVTVLYKTTQLVDAFSTVLVSEPLTATLVSGATLGWGNSGRRDGFGSFNSLASVTCGAKGSGMALGVDAKYHVETTYATVPLNAEQDGAGLPGTVFATDAPDGSTVELLPGARLVFLNDFTYVSLEGAATATLSTVVAWAPVTGAGAVTADRFVGPQQTTFTAGPATACQAGQADLTLNTVHTVIVGQWRITAPDGTVTTVEAASGRN
ncbi:hypothetical protein [Demequina lutea]|uniref:Uncharacterized protein n=1 Tax=Demequina lutea TaxID=431489 RepID=A0A7Z0CJ21_9MICO|nr:hypothetical protein [Demequina lutea]NYI40277.1 hypothetical protein [Demequina lutea]